MGFSGQNSQRLKSILRRVSIGGGPSPISCQGLFDSGGVDIGDEIAQPGDVCASLVRQFREPRDDIDARAVQEVLKLGDAGIWFLASGARRFQ